VSKLPFLQLYPSDWEADAVAGCSLAAQGLWLRMMFLMHRSERYGYLVENGLPIPSDAVARRCGCYPEAYQSLLAELERAGIPSLSSDGVIFSRRMVRDAQKREKNANRMRSARAVQPLCTPCAREKLEVRSYISEKEKQTPTGSVFAVFWEEYPNKDGGQLAAKQAWVRVLGDSHSGEILAALSDWKAQRWKEGKYVPYADKWLLRRQWQVKPDKQLAPGEVKGRNTDAAIERFKQRRSGAGVA